MSHVVNECVMSSGLCRVPLMHKSDVYIVPRLVAFAIMRHISNEGVESRLYRWVMSLSMSHVSNARVEARLEWMRHVVRSMHSPCNALQHTTSEYSQNQRSHARSHNVVAVSIGSFLWECLVLRVDGFFFVMCETWMIHVRAIHVHPPELFKWPVFCESV
jgi:hypothetical protein